MKDIVYINRINGKKETEQVYKKGAIDFLYGPSFISSLARFFLLPLIAGCSLFSRFYGFIQKQPWSARKIRPFIKEFQIDESEFLDPVSSFHSFNDFFIRRLKPEARPIASGENEAMIPADGRYYFYPSIASANGFSVKGQFFSLEKLLQNEVLANEYKEGSMVMARLCPSDYHRFHFPCEGIPGPTTVINGTLYSVNPLAIQRNIEIFSENKRTVCEFRSSFFGPILYLAIGATNVGSIKETHSCGVLQSKGAEKGYFEFGGSALILLFKRGTILFDSDLIQATQDGMEIRCLMGQRMGTMTSGL